MNRHNAMNEPLGDDTLSGDDMTSRLPLVMSLRGPKRRQKGESQPMRIAVIAGEFPKVSETFVLHHINGLIQRGHDVDVYAEYRPRGSDFARNDAMAASLLGRTSYIDIPSLKTGKRLLTAPYRLVFCSRAAPRLALATLNPSQFGRNALNLSEMNRLYKLARVHRKYDVIHAHFGMVGDRFRFVSALWKAPLVVNFHGYDVSVWPHEQGRNCYTRLFEVASAVVVNSENTRRRVIELGCPPQKTDKIYPAWDMANFPYSDRQRGEGQQFRVLTVARLVEVKGVEDAVSAIALVRKTYPNVRYDIIGDGPLRSRLEGLIATLGLKDAVTLHGAQPRDYVRRMMDGAHAFLSPSVTTSIGAQEGLGVALLEAQASGLPVVATEHGAFPEVVAHGETGYLAPEHSPEQLAKWLGYLIENPQAATQMGHAAREHVERNFAPEQINTQYIELYERVINSFRAKQRG